MHVQEIDYKNIPVQAEVVVGIVRLDVESPTCFRDLDAYVHADQGVATLVMRVVNSALYSRGNKISTIPRAISVLGFRVVRSLAMLAFSRSLFARTSNPLIRIHIWQHSLLTGLAGQSLIKVLGPGAQTDEAFVAGLMHDIGKVLMSMHDPEGYQKVLELVLDSGMPSVEAERQVLGCDHCEVGREAVAQWRLPERFNDYMGDNLANPSDEIRADPVRFTLACANRVIGGFGVGARRIDDALERQAQLQAWGLENAVTTPWVQDEFLSQLTESDVYKLCANL